jgi:hypothetical protein
MRLNIIFNNGQRAMLGKWQPILVASSLVTTLWGCSQDDADRAPKQVHAEGKPLYAVFTSVATPDDDSTSYLGITSSLGGDSELDIGNAIEMPGASRFYAPEGGGFFALGSNEDLTITRFDVSEDGQVEQTGKVSFAGVGVERLHYRAVFVSETKAYYIDHTQGQMVIWNPAQMEIERTVPLPEELSDGFMGFTSVLPYFRYPHVADALFIPVAWYDFENGKARDVTGLVVFDTKTDTVASYTETDRCAGATELAFDDNGDVYFGTSVNHPWYANAFEPKRRERAQPGCILRIRSGEKAFDEDYRLDLRELLGDRTSMGLTDAARPGLGYVQAIDTEQQAWAELSEEDTFWETPAWQWWQIDLREGKAELDRGIPSSAPYMTSYDVDGERYISRQSGDNASRMYHLSAVGDHEESLRSIGEIRAVSRVR